MARTKGCLGRVEVGATPALVGEVRSYNVDEQAPANDASSMGSCSPVYEAGLVGSSIQLTCWFDAADAGQVALQVGESLDITIQPASAGSGNPQLKVTGALITGHTVSAEVAGIVEAQFNAQGGKVDRTAQT